MISILSFKGQSEEGDFIKLKYQLHKPSFNKENLKLEISIYFQIYILCVLLFI